MKIYNFWLTAFGESGPIFETASPRWGCVVDPGGEGVGGRGAIKSEAETEWLWGDAVVKVTPSVGSVKYKAQHVVLAVRIPVLMGGKWPGGAKNGGFCCGFSRKGAKLVGFT
jgi:hypothetical protein